jgi:hypothetical protein
MESPSREAKTARQPSELEAQVGKRPTVRIWKTIPFFAALRSLMNG